MHTGNTHTEKVEAIQRQTAEFYRKREGFRIYHGSTNSTRRQSFNSASSIDMSGFNAVIEINADTKSAVVEPNVPMDALVKETLQYGLIPAVVMEFPGITVGGGIQGGAGESSSFKYGLFSDTCKEYEFITPDGKLLVLNERENTDLFNATPGSYGTFGVITAAHIDLIAAKKYVHLEYFPVSTYEEAVKMTNDLTKKHYDFIDGIMYSPSEGVILAGTLSDEELENHVTFHAATDEWFYLHVERHKTEKRIESIPVYDYLFRYDRGAFWVGRYTFERSGVPFNRFTRILMSRLMTTRKLYEALQLSGADQQYVVQDLALPSERAAELMAYIEQTLTAFPLWICPLRPNTKNPLLLTYSTANMLINIGVWSNKAFRVYDDFIEVNRHIEHKLISLGGRKWFYAHSFYTEGEFWDIFDQKWYNGLREKYHATHLPTIFMKIRSGPYHPVRIKRAALRAIFNIAKLKIR